MPLPTEAQDLSNAEAESFSASPMPPEAHSEDAGDIAALAQTIKRAGMAEPAALLLHIARPLAWAGGQALWMLQPFLESTGVGRRSAWSIPGLARLFEREASVDELIEQLSCVKRET